MGTKFGLHSTKHIRIKVPRCIEIICGTKQEHIMRRIVFITRALVDMQKSKIAENWDRAKKKVTVFVKLSKKETDFWDTSSRKERMKFLHCGRG